MNVFEFLTRDTNLQSFFEFTTTTSRVYFRFYRQGNYINTSVYIHLTYRNSRISEEWKRDGGDKDRERERNVFFEHGRSKAKPNVKSKNNNFIT